MARAKRTDRADARRRYRQTLVDEDQGDMGEADSTPEPARSGAPRRTPAAAGATSGRTLGFMDAMRVAWHRPDLRADIASLPWLLRTWGFLLPLALVVAGGVAVFVAPTNTIAGFFFQLVVLPPAMAPIFIVGFFAKRASYLLGLIIAVVDLIAYTAFVYVVLPLMDSTLLTAAHQQELVASAFAVGPLSGLFFAAGAAWYRRFLSLSSAQRGRRSSGNQRSKGKTARG